MHRGALLQRVLKLGLAAASVSKPTVAWYDPRSRSQVEPCDFCVRRVIVSRLGVKDGQKCPFKDSNLVSPPWHVGWDTALFAGKYPHVHLVPLNVGFRLQEGKALASNLHSAPRKL
jgi:hypothetical protein